MQPKNEKSLAVGVAEIVAAYVSHENHGVPPEGLAKMVLDLANAFKEASQETTTQTVSASPAVPAARIEAPAVKKQAEAPAPAPAPAPVAVVAEERTSAVTETAPTVSQEQPAPQARKRGRKAAPKVVAADETTQEVTAPLEVPAEEVAVETVQTLEDKFGDKISRTPWMNMKPEDAIKPSVIICLIDGLGRKMMHRHLKSKHGMTPEEYREWFNLPSDYPMTAPGYSKEKSAYAKEVGLGTTAFAEKTKAKATPKLARRQRGSKAAGRTTTTAKANA